LERQAGRDVPPFAAHAAFYPAAGLVFDGKALTGAPILLMVGETDDWTPAKRIHAMVAEWKKTRPDAPVEIKAYPTGHGWLGRGSGDFQPARSGLGECPLTVYDAENRSLSLVELSGAARPADQAAVEATYRKCTRLGATTTPNASVTERSLADLTAFLQRALAR
jgi:dienelactone hydrolase